MENENSRNTIIFMVCAAVVFVVYQVFVMDPQAKRQQAARAAAAAAAAAAPHAASTAAGSPGSFIPRAQAVAESPRVTLDSPHLTGSIALRGARIDDLYLKTYRKTIDPKSPRWELLRPQGAEHAWFADLGWGGANVPGLPDLNTLWSAAPGARLTPTTPLTLTYDNGQGLKFTRTIALDADYMFTVNDTVANTAAQAVALASFGSVQQFGLPAATDLANSGIVHEGAIGALESDPGSKKFNLVAKKYKDWKKAGEIVQNSTGGWLGITEKYWLAALIPDPSAKVKAEFRVVPINGVDVYQAGFVGPSQTIAPGASVTMTTHLFAGAKTVPLLQKYQATLGVARLDDAVDWGNFWFLTRPLFALLEFINHYLGAIGLSILALTVVVKLVFFPLANMSYDSMNKMKKIQPKVEELRKKFEKDPAQVQQETMKLYQQEKINPLLGCLPMLVQIPVFYSLYKVLTVTIEMRQAPFYGWIHDLSSRDPTSIWTLFGLIPWNPAHLALIGGFLDGPFHIGLWPLAYGLSMWLSMSMSPQQPDPTQQRIMQLMPIIFTFTMSQFTVGLIIYWTWSNLLSILQQYYMMHRAQVENPIDTGIAWLFKRKAAG